MKKNNKSLKLNATLNSIRQICSIMFSLVTFPYVTRILGVDIYGRVNFCNSIVGYFAMVAALGFGTYAIREGTGLRTNRHDIDLFASDIFTLNLLSTMASYLLLGLFLLIWRRPEDYKVLVIINSFTIILSTIGMDWLFGIYEDYVYITIRSLLIQGASLLALFIFVKSSEDYITYAIILCISSGASNIFNFIRTRKYVKLRIGLDKNAKKHILPVLILFFNAALVTIYLNSDITMLRIFQSETAVGEYSVAVRIYSIVKSIIAAVTVVTVPRLSFYARNGQNNQFKKLVENTLGCLISICFPSIIGLLLLSKDIIVLLSGRQYVGGTISLRILCFALLFSTVANLLTSGVLISQRKEKTVLIASIIGGLTNIALNFVLIPILSLNGAAITTLLAELIVCVFAFINSKESFSLKCIKGVLFPVAIGCIGIVVICVLLDKSSGNQTFLIFAKVFLSALCYLVVQLLLKNNVVKELLRRRYNE